MLFEVSSPRGDHDENGVWARGCRDVKIGFSENRLLHFAGNIAICGAGGWQWTNHSPTGSGPEGSSPNEPRLGSLVGLPPSVSQVASMPDTLTPADQTAASPYRVLARKYRPQSFADLIGHGAMVRTLENAFDTGRIAQGWMLTGVRGVGKTTTARILARALNYEIPGEIDPPHRAHGSRGHPLPRHHGGAACRRHRDGRRLAYRRRRCARHHRGGSLQAGVGPATRSTSSTKCTCCRRRPSTRS